MATHVYALLGQRDIEACLTLAREALTHWEDGWCPKSGIDISCSEARLADVPSDAIWVARRQAGEPALWSYHTPEFMRQAEHLLFGLGAGGRNTDGRRESDIAADVAKRAVADLMADLSRTLAPAALDEGDAAPPDWQFHRSGGAALLQFASSGKSCGLLVPHTSMPRRTKSAPAAPQTALTPLPAALVAKQARLTAELDGADISLGNLTTLSPGDVITLEHALDQPLKVYDANRRLLALAHLGKQEDHHALQMFAATQK